MKPETPYITTLLFCTKSRQNLFVDNVYIAHLRNVQMSICDVMPSQMIPSGSSGL